MNILNQKTRAILQEYVNPGDWRFLFHLNTERRAKQRIATESGGIHWNAAPANLSIPAVRNCISPGVRVKDIRIAVDTCI